MVLASVSVWELMRAATGSQWSSTEMWVMWENLRGSTGALRQICQERVTLVLSRDDKGLNMYLSGLRGEKWANSSDESEKD